MDNPFVTKGYAGAEYFCDRVEETKKLVELTTNGNTEPVAHLIFM